MQLSVIELVRSQSLPPASGVPSSGGNVEQLPEGTGPTPQQMKGRYLRAIFDLLNAAAHSVKYEAAMTLTTLTQNPAAVKGGFNNSSFDIFLAG